MTIRRWIIAFALAGLSSGSLSAAEVVDARGRTIATGDASRVIAIGGAVTEIVYALGLGDRIVAVDTTSTYPAEAEAKPDIGYMRALSAEGVLALNPSLILAVEGSGPPEVMAVLENASVPFVIVPDEASAEGVAEKIRVVAQALGAAERGEELAKTVAEDLAAVEAMLAGIEDRQAVVFVLGMQGGAPLAAGDGTSAEAILTLAGARNALGGFAGFKPVSSEAVLAAAPQAVVTMAERGHTLGGDVLGSPAFAATPAGRDGRSVSMSGSYLLGFGPRTAHAARDLAAALYPDRPMPELPDRPWAAAAGL